MTAYQNYITSAQARKLRLWGKIPPPRIKEIRVPPVPEPPPKPEGPLSEYQRCKYIKAVVAHLAGLMVHDLEGPYRTVPMARARQIAMHFMRTQTLLSLPLIGKRLGNRDHSTIHHGHNLVLANPQRFEPLLSQVRAVLCPEERDPDT